MNWTPKVVSVGWKSVNLSTHPLVVGDVFLYATMWISKSDNSTAAWEIMDSEGRRTWLEFDRFELDPEDTKEGEGVFSNSRLIQRLKKCSEAVHLHKTSYGLEGS